ILGWFLWSQGASNLKSRGISVSWDFLDQPPGIAIREGIDTRPQTGARALFVGIVNMLRVSIAGIFAATLLGTIVGVARLSHNWIVNKIATVYIETIRNIPLLVQIIFWGAVLTALPNLTLDSGPIEGWLFVSNKGISFPWLFPAAGFYQWMVFVIAGIVASVFVHRRLLDRKLKTGQETRPNLMAFGTVVLFAAVGWFAHPLVGFIGNIMAGIANAIDALPTFVMQLVLAAAALGLAAWWIKGFLDNLRTPAGLAKLTDDDYFRIISVALSGLVAAVFFLVVSGVASWLLGAGHDFFVFLDNKFEFLGTGNPLRGAKPDIVQTGNFPNYGNAGMTMTNLFFPVFIGVTIYTGAFIAEIVRAGILAVSKGQSEAGLAVGLKRGQLLRLVVLPQAFRIMLPPMGNQYLNVAKNTSLGIAVGYPELVAVGQTIYNQTGATVPVVLLWMIFYLSVSLFLSFIVNWYNRKLQLVER
ncbi:MAG: ABC transporter permease subunit, partial [Acidimicrobiia bacterium]|nr:ABC transporter permease subunit [Acidimicrobiia bacterium]